tara:strand:- start:7824 stop:10049 length:2226 start_codon:yes stop_codon:yes gene_type:complete
MAREQRIDPGKLVPAAKPVSTFLNFQKGNIPNAAQPQKLNTPPGINIIQRGNVSNVEGYNSMQQMADAIGKLIPAIDSAAKIHTSHQYEKAQNQILKAASNINDEQILQKYDYAAQGKELERNNKAAAIIWDELDPHHKAVMNNQGSTIAASKIQLLFEHAYNTAEGIETWDAGDPRLTKIKGNVVNVLKSLTGLDEYSHGFIKKINPVITREWEKFSNQQYTAKRKNDRYQYRVQTATGMMDLLSNYYSRMDPEDFKVVWSQYITDVKRNANLAEDSLPMIKASILQTADLLKKKHLAGDQKAGSLLRTLSTLDAGHDGPDGKLTGRTIGDLFGPEIAVSTSKVAQALWKKDSDAQKDGKAYISENYANRLVKAVRNRNTEEIAKIEQEVLADKNSPLRRDGKMEVMREIVEESKKLDAVLPTEQSIKYEDLKSKYLFKSGLEFDVNEMNREIVPVIESIPNKTQMFSIYDDYKQFKETKLNEANSRYRHENYNETIKNQLDLTVKDMYPDVGMRMAAGEKIDILEFLKEEDANKAKGFSRYRMELHNRAQSKIINKLSKDEKIKLTDAEVNVLVTEAAKDIKDDPALMKELFPGGENITTEKILNSGGDSDKKVLVPEGKYTLDTGIRQADLDAFNEQPLYTVDAVKRIYENRERGFHYQFKEAARKLGLSPEKLLLRHLEFYQNYPNLEWMPNEFEMQQLEILGNQAQGMIDGVITGSAGSTALAQTSRLFENVLLGV